MNMNQKKYRIGELAKNLEVEDFVIRFWEKEFKIKSQRSQGGQRFYSEQDFEKFKLIKNLLYEKKFTIQGAKGELKNAHTKNRIIPSTLDLSSTNEIQEKIKELYAQLIKLKELL